MITRLDAVLELSNKTTQENMCLLCQETRGLHQSHIIPKHFIKTGITIKLCPSHHQYYDNGELTKDEQDTLLIACKELLEVMAKDIYETIQSKGLPIRKGQGFIRLLNEVF